MSRPGVVETGRSGGVTIDLSGWPIAVMNVLDGSVPEFADNVEAALRQAYARKRRFGLVVDARTVRVVPTAPTRKRLMEMSRDFDLLSRTYCVGSAYLIESVIARGALTAIHWLYPAPTPMAFPASMKEAQDWLRTLLAEPARDSSR